jgi:chaperonin GroEL (HSP60 family)
MAPKTKRVKHTVKYLANCRHPQIINQILRKADYPLVKGIANAALNVTHGEVPLTRQKKRLFSRHRKIFELLTAKKKSLEAKKKVIQKGGAFGALIPILLSTVLGTIGSAIFNR